MQGSEVGRDSRHVEGVPQRVAVWLNRHPGRGESPPAVGAAARARAMVSRHRRDKASTGRVPLQSMELRAHSESNDTWTCVGFPQPSMGEHGQGGAQCNAGCGGVPLNTEGTQEGSDGSLGRRWRTLYSVLWEMRAAQLPASSRTLCRMVPSGSGRPTSYTTEVWKGPTTAWPPGRWLQGRGGRRGVVSVMRGSAALLHTPGLLLQLARGSSSPKDPRVPRAATRCTGD